MTKGKKEKAFNRITKNQGFSLVEMVVVIVITGIIFGMGALIIQRGFTSFFAGKNIVNADWQGRIALERMTRELREIRSPTATDITTMTAAQIVFNDSDGNNINYTTVGTQLTRNGVVLADNINGLALSYLQNDGRSAAAVATAIYYITVSAVIIQDAATTTTYRTTIRPRNF